MSTSPNDEITLNCLIWPTATFEANLFTYTLSASSRVEALQWLITADYCSQFQNTALNDTGTLHEWNVDLWLPKDPIGLGIGGSPTRESLRDIRYDSKTGRGVTSLVSTVRLSAYFDPEKEEKAYVDVLVELPNEEKRRYRAEYAAYAEEYDLTKLDSGPAHAFWAHWWTRSGEPPRPLTQKVRLKSDDHPAPSRVDFAAINSIEARIMSGHPFLPPEIKEVLYRDEYDAIMEYLAKTPLDWSVMILSGHPGTGKTLFLYTLLARRLSQNLPTAFQTLYEDPNSSDLLIFTSRGVFRVNRPNSTSHDAVGHLLPYNAWALVDFDAHQRDCKMPANFLWSPHVGRFILCAAPPNPKFWKGWSKEHTLLFWSFKPWTLDELLLGRSVQRQISPSPTKSQIKYFVDTYGFNARAAYAYAVDPQKYEVQLNNDLFLTPPFEMIQWFNITRLLSMVDNDYSTDSDAHPFQGIPCHPSRRKQERPGYHDPQ